MTGAANRRRGHGTRGTYRTGCRCSDCRTANTNAERERRARHGWKPRVIPPCAIEGCPRPHAALGYCELHYGRLKRHGDPLKNFFHVPPRDRIRARVVVDDNGCWIWQLAINDNGYGVTWDGERTVLAHRYSYEAFIGPIPDGLHIDHLCRVRACVNPDPAHLEPVTQAENNRRSSRWQ